MQFRAEKISRRINSKIIHRLIGPRYERCHFNKSHHTIVIRRYQVIGHSFATNHIFTKVCPFISLKLRNKWNWISTDGEWSWKSFWLAAATMLQRELQLLLLLFTSRCVASGSCEFSRIFHFPASVGWFAKHIDWHRFWESLAVGRATFSFCAFPHLHLRRNNFSWKWLRACIRLFICIPFRIHALMFFDECDGTRDVTADCRWHLLIHFCLLLHHRLCARSVRM